MSRFFFLLIVLFYPAVTHAVETEITVFAGDGTAKWNGLGESATSTALATPNGLALGSDGGVLIAEAESNQVFLVDDTTGSISILAGCGFAGFAGDDGPATEAFLTKPYAVLENASGEVLISDQWNHRIRKVSNQGIIETIAGSGEGFFGLGAYSGDGGSALKAGLNFPSGISIGKEGALFIADQMNARVRRVDKDGKIATFAGKGAELDLPLERPIDVRHDSRGNLLIVDAGTNQIYSASTTGKASILIGPPISETMIPRHPGIYLNFPVAVEVSDDGTLFWAETKNNRVCGLFPGEKEMEVLMEGAKAPGIRIRGTADKEDQKPKLGRPTDLLLLDDGSLLVADPESHKVWKIAFPKEDEDQS